MHKRYPSKCQRNSNKTNIFKKTLWYINFEQITQSLNLKHLVQRWLYTWFLQYVLYGTKYICITNALAITFAAIKVKLVTMSAVSYCWVRSEICNILLKQYNDVLYWFFYKYFRNFFANLRKFRNGVYFLNFTINFVNKSTIKSFQNMTPLSRPNLYTIFFWLFSMSSFFLLFSFVVLLCWKKLIGTLPISLPLFVVLLRWEKLSDPLPISRTLWENLSEFIFFGSIFQLCLQDPEFH